jgi:hypothetical protein
VVDAVVTFSDGQISTVTNVSGSTNVQALIDKIESEQASSGSKVVNISFHQRDSDQAEIAAEESMSAAESSKNDSELEASTAAVLASNASSLWTVNARPSEQSNTESFLNSVGASGTGFISVHNLAYTLDMFLEVGPLAMCSSYAQYLFAGMSGFRANRNKKGVSDVSAMVHVGKIFLLVLAFTVPSLRAVQGPLLLENADSTATDNSQGIAVRDIDQATSVNASISDKEKEKLAAKEVSPDRSVPCVALMT